MMRNLLPSIDYMLYSFALMGCSLIAAPAWCQESEQDDKPRVEEMGPLAEGNEQAEMTKLFHEVEGRLEKIGALLLDASTGDTSRLAEIGGSGIDELIESLPNQPSGSASGGGIASLLRSSRSEGDQVLTGIDRILEIAQQQGGSCSKPGNGQGQGQKPGDAPQQGQSQPGSRKNPTPEEPSEDGQEQPQEQEGDPKNNQDSENPTPARPADEAPGNETQDPVQVIEDLERWGDLPVHLRDIFRAEGGRDMPAQYRDWIDSYFRRLNERSNDR